MLCDRTMLIVIGAQLELSIVKCGGGTASLLLPGGSSYAGERRCRLSKDHSKRHPYTSVNYGIAAVFE